jgi:hypothetical protein
MSPLSLGTFSEDATSAVRAGASSGSHEGVAHVSTVIRASRSCVIGGPRPVDDDDVDVALLQFPCGADPREATAEDEDARPDGAVERFAHLPMAT